MKKLTAMQRLFVAEYLVDLNATQAAIRAGYSKKSAYRIGADLLHKTSVAEAIAAAMKEREKRTNITQDRVLNEIAKVAFGDMRNVMSWGPEGVRLKDSKGISADAAAFVSEVSETVTENGGTVRLKVNDKLKALELLGRHLGVFKDNRDADKSVSVNVVIEGEAAQRKAVRAMMRGELEALRKERGDG
ncbi:terminase small subunit [Cloacibacillus evryensis]|uniref:terminase small subunit n=1 Tax=Cloacibacillus evryensis TaxID=508460 RepID=UPI00241CBEBF|nr:terminase small subunit [Cloacibacillus evryensis]